MEDPLVVLLDHKNVAFIDSKPILKILSQLLALTFANPEEIISDDFTNSNLIDVFKRCITSNKDVTWRKKFVTMLVVLEKQKLM